MALIALALLATRLPLLAGSFGSDDDAWRNVVAALHGLSLGRYAPSRPPGFPVFELPLMAMVGWGPVATNLFAALAGLVSAWGLHGVAHRAGHRAPGLLAVGWALAPPLWVHATQTMDYALGLAFMTTAWWALLARRPATAGLLLALAAGTRATLGGLALPFSLWLVLTSGLRGPLVRFLAAFFIPAVLTYVPLAFLPETNAHGTGLLFHVARQHLTLASAPAAVRAAFTWSFGRLGLVALAAGLIVSRLRRGATSATREQAAGAALEWSAIAMIVMAWALVPLDQAYLLPALPFALSLAARALNPLWLAIVLLAGASEALVLPLPAAGRLAPGWLFLERAERREQLGQTRAWLGAQPQEPTVFVVGRAETQRLVALGRDFQRRAPAWAPFDGPGVALWDPARRLGFAATLDQAGRDSLERSGVRVRNQRSRPSPVSGQSKFRAIRTACAFN